MRCRIFHVTKCYYSAVNVEGFVTSRGEYAAPGDCMTLPPGYKNATFAPCGEGTPPPEFVRSKAGYFVPAGMPPRPTPLFPTPTPTTPAAEAL